MSLSEQLKITDINLIKAELQEIYADFNKLQSRMESLMQILEDMNIMEK